MAKANPLSKRIKRQVIGRPHRFFIATTPGLNRVCHDELSSLRLPISDGAPHAGGVEFMGRLEDCYRGNLYLRTANRILMRLCDVRATNFRQLKKYSADFPWELYLYPQSRLEFSVSTSHCRLYHKEAIRDGILSGIDHRLASYSEISDNEDEPSPQERLFVRGVDDRFTLSLDSSGDILYKRGIKIHGGRAPIRETIAAASLRLAGFTGKEPVLDPMCGSGTFSLEAGMMSARIPPGWFREFAFTHWPSFKPKQWVYIKNETKPHFRFPEKPVVFASDVDGRTIDTLGKTIQSMGLSKNIAVFSRNFFDFHPREITGGTTGIVVINPPYGVRLETKQTGRQLFKNIIKKLRSDYKNWKCILISPEKKLIEGLSFQNAVYPVFHGGLTVYLVVGNI